MRKKHKKSRLEPSPWTSQRSAPAVAIDADDLDDVADMAIVHDPWKIIEQYLNFGQRSGGGNGRWGYSSGKPWSALYATQARRSLERLRKLFPKGQSQATAGALMLTFRQMSRNLSRATVCGHASHFRSLFKWAKVARGNENPMEGWGEPEGIEKIWKSSRTTS